MNYDPQKRMKLVDGENEAPAQRTKAKQEAARKDNARGQGPSTADAKARSRKNGLSHDLLARKMAPPSDARGDNKLFYLIRAGLIEEWQPATFTDFATINELASDYLNLARVRQMMERIQAPLSLPPSDAEKWQKIQDCKKDINLLKRVIAQAKNGDNFAFSIKDANRAAKIIRGLGERVMQDLAEIQQERDAAAKEVAKNETDQSDAPDPVEEEEQEQQEERTLWIKMNDDGRPWFEDVIDLAATLRGSKPTSRKFQTNLAQVLTYPLKRLQQIISFYKPVLNQAKRLCDDTVAGLASSPESLVLLQRYQRPIEDSIEQRLRSLKASRG